MIRTLARLLPVFTLAAAGLTAAAPTALATSCPPSGVVWSSSNQFTAEPDGQYTLNNNMWGEVAGSQATMYLQTVGGTVGLCNMFQPVTSPNTIKSAPGIALSLPGNAISSYANISDTFTTQTGTAGDWETEVDVWLNATSGASAIEVMMWTQINGSRAPAGTKIGTATINSQLFNVYDGTVNNHPVYTFVLQGSETSGTDHLKVAFNWLQSHGYFSESSTTLLQIGFGWEFEDVSNGSGGTTSAFKITSYSTTVS